MKKHNPIVFAPSRFVTPVGTAKWCHLAKPRNDDRFGTVNYECTIVLEKNAETAKFLKSLEQAAAELCKQIGKPVPDMTWIRKTDDGSTSLSFKRPVRDGIEKPIPILDQQKLAAAEPWGGDKIRVAFGLGMWKTAMGYGIKPYPNGVQVIERRRGADVANVFPDDLPTVESVTDIPF
jgi:hypothetical protein